MNIYLIKFFNGNLGKGIALVAARDCADANRTLMNQGQFNGIKNGYKIVTTEIWGEADIHSPKLLAEDNSAVTLIKGVDGKDGEDGKDGKDGKPGPKGDPFTYNDFTLQQLAGLKGEKGDKFTWSEVTKEEKKEMAESIVKPLMKDLVFKGVPVDVDIKSINRTIPTRVAELERKVGNDQSLNLIKIGLKNLEQKVEENDTIVKKLSININNLIEDQDNLEERVSIVEDKIDIFASNDDINKIFN